MVSNRQRSQTPRPAAKPQVEAMTSENSYSVIRMAVRGSFLHERVASSRWQFGTVC